LPDTLEFLSGQKRKRPGGSEAYLFNGYPNFFFQGLKLSEREVLCLPPPSDEITKEWTYTSIFPVAFLACTYSPLPYTVIFRVPLLRRFLNTSHNGVPFKTLLVPPGVFMYPRFRTAAMWLQSKDCRCAANTAGNVAVGDARITTYEAVTTNTVQETRTVYKYVVK